MVNSLLAWLGFAFKLEMRVLIKSLILSWSNSCSKNFNSVNSGGNEIKVFAVSSNSMIIKTRILGMDIYYWSLFTSLC